MFKRSLPFLIKNINIVPKRNSIITRKKFYKLASVTKDNGTFEISLDGRKLKTPKGNVFNVNDETLALMIAQEWNGQQDQIRMHEMHLTTLANTFLDNPLHLEKEDIVKKMIENLSSDTICFRMAEPQELYELQLEKWDPIKNWFENFFDCKIPTTKSVILDDVPKETIRVITNYLNSFKIESLYGLQFILDNLKSILISLALVNNVVSVNDAVSLSRLEQEFQINKWGLVEWAHDTDLMLLRSRVASGLLYFLLNNTSITEEKRKIKK